jgi:predicted amidohydrolase YtcJ
MIRLAILFSSLLLAVSPAAEVPDVIYYNGKIVTMSAAQPRAEAIAIKGNRFLLTGSNAEVRKLAAPETKQIDLHGRTVLPGLEDSHTHPITSALSERDGPIPVMNSIAEIQAYIRKQAAILPPDQVIFVPKIYSTRLQDRRYPTREEIDKAAPGRLAMTDNGYASVLNSTLLAKLNITRDTPQPSDGKIIKDAKGEPTGLILGAPRLLSTLRQSRAASHEDRLRGLIAMQKAYNQVGMTSTIDRGQNMEGFRVYQELRDKNALTVRSYVTYLIDAKGTPQEVREEIAKIPWVTGHGDDWFRVGSLKTIADGGILIGTAYLREPYGMNTKIYGYDDPDYRGVLAVPRENLIEMAKQANKRGWQMTAHTTGGGATDALLDAYEAADKEQSIRKRRFTVTHGNFPNPDAIARAAKLGVVFDCQPAWMYYDAPTLKDVFGPARSADWLPLRSLFNAGIVVAGGSDHMIRFDSRKAINPYNPFFEMWMAITRRTVDGATFHPEQAVSRMEALRMWTLNGAYLSFEERAKGSIEAGKLADMVVIDKDFLGCPVDQIKDIEALVTIVDGRVVYGNPAVL